MSIDRKICRSRSRAVFCYRLAQWEVHLSYEERMSGILLRCSAPANNWSSAPNRQVDGTLSGWDSGGAISAR